VHLPWPVSVHGRVRAGVLFASLVLTMSCDETAPGSPHGAPSVNVRIAEAARTVEGAGVEIVAAPESLDNPTRWIRSENERAKKDDRVTLVYVGASWCVPCQAFRRLVHEGAFDKALPRLRLLAFDADIHAVPLGRSGCATTAVPTFMRPMPKGRCSAQKASGIAAGKDPVAYLTPRLERLMSGSR